MVIKCQYEQWIEASRLTPKVDQWFMFWHLPDCADIGLLCFITGYSEMLTGFLSLEQSKLHMASWSPPAFSFPPLRASSLSSRLSSCSKSTLSHLLTLYAHGWRTEKTGESSVVPKGSCSWISCPAKLSSNVDKHWLCGHSYAATGWFNLVKEHKRVHTLLHLIQHVPMFDINDIKMYSGRECE